MKKRAMALALSVAMVLGSVPFSVSAEEPEVSVEVVEAEAEANEAQAGEAEATGEPAEEAEEAEEIIAEPQIAVESLEEVPEAAAEEPAEVTLAPANDAVAAASHNITDVTISGGEPSVSVNLTAECQDKAKALDLTTGNNVMKIMYDPGRTTMDDVVKALNVTVSNGSGTPKYKLSLEGNYLGVTCPDAADDAYKKNDANSAYLCINFLGEYADLKAAYVKFEIIPRNIAKSNVKYDILNSKGTVNGKETFAYTGEPIKLTGLEVKDKVTVTDSNGKQSETEVGLSDAGTTKQTSGNYYMVTFDDDSKAKDLTNAGTKTATITGTGYYTGTKTVDYEVVGKDYAAGDISVPTEELTFNASASANETLLLAKIKNMVGGTEKALATADHVDLIYYKLETVDGKETETPQESAGKDNFKVDGKGFPTTPGKYRYKVVINGAGNFNVDSSTGKKETGLAGTFVVKSALTTLGEVYDALIATKALQTDYDYSAKTVATQKKEIADRIKSDFNAYDPAKNYGDQIEFTWSKIDAAETAIMETGSYFVTVKPTGEWAKVSDAEKIIEVKINPRSILKDGALDKANFVVISATQGTNYDKSYAKNGAVVKFGWKENSVFGNQGVTELKEDKDFTVTPIADSADPDKIAKVTITGINNYKDSVEASVTDLKKVDLSQLKEGAKVNLKEGKTTEADIEIYDKAGKRIPAVAESGSKVAEYFILSEDCSNGHTTTGKHWVTVRANGSGNCTGELTIEFTINGVDFAEAYIYDNKNVKNPTVDVNVTDSAPHKTVRVLTKDGKSLLGDFATNCKLSYVWVDDPKTDEADKLTLVVDNGNKESDESAFDNKFTKPGKWKLVIEPTKKVENGRYSGKLEVPFEVEKKKFVLKTTTTPTGLEVRNTNKADTRTVEWMGGKGISQETLRDTFEIYDNGTQVVYKTGYEIANVTNNDKAGTAVVTLRGINNYSSDTFDVNVTIAKKSLEKNTAKLEVINTGYQGDGSFSLQPEDVKITFNEDSFEGDVPTSDYTVTDPVTTSGKDFAMGSTVKVTVKATAEGNYTGSRDVEFTIGKADIGNENVFVLRTADQKDVHFLEDGKVEPVVELYNKRTEKVVYTNADSAASGFEVNYTDQDKVGTATVTVKAADTNEFYTGTATLKYTIATAKAGAVELKNNGVFTYTGKALDAKTDVIAAVCGKDGKETTDYEAVWEGDNKNAGSAVLVVTGDGFETRVGVTIKPASIVGAEIGNLTTTYEYTGDVVRPEVTVTVNGTKLVRNVDYQLMNTEETGLGEKGLAVHGINNYTGDILEHFTVVPASLKGAKVVVKNAVYNGKVRKPAVTVSIDGKRLKAANYTVTYDNTAKIGAKTATIEGKGNYTGTVTAAYKVTPAKAVISKVTAGTKKLTVAVKAQTGAKYQIFYRQKGTKKWSVVLSAKASKAITVKSGVKYQVRVRAYAVMNGAKSFGTLSTVKTSAKVK